MNTIRIAKAFARDKDLSLRWFWNHQNNGANGPIPEGFTGYMNEENRTLYPGEYVCVEWENNIRVYFYRGLTHRSDGPAIEGEDYPLWFLDGDIMSRGEWERLRGDFVERDLRAEIKDLVL
jgi:hypothetical protein